MPRVLLLTSLLLALVPAAAQAAAPIRTLVVCAPGSPGDTASAQPTMDAFAKAAAEAAGWPAGSLRAVYHETADGGLHALAQSDAALGLLALPFFLKNETGLTLRASLQVVEDPEPLEIWSLVAARGRVTTPDALAGWEITGVAGYAPRFVGGVVLQHFGAPPPTARITYAAGVLSALRRASTGEPLAVVLDGAQTKGLASLPFVSSLEVVATSDPLPGALLCAVGKRLTPKQSDQIARGLLHLQDRPEWRELLGTMRLEKFEKVDQPALDAIRRSYAAARP